MRVRFFCAAAVSLLLIGSLAQAALLDDFESYADQAAFEAVYKPLFNDASSMGLVPGFGYDPSAGDPQPQSYSGIAGGNHTTRNYRYLDSFTDYVGTDAKPLVVEYMINILDPANTGARNYNELRAVDTDGFANAPPYAAGTAPVFGGSLQGLIAMGVYNSGVDTKKWNARLIGGGNSAWFSLAADRAAGWHKLTAKVYGSKVDFYVDDAFDTTKSLNAAIPAWDAILLGSGLPSNTMDAAFDNLRVEVVPEPATLGLLTLGVLGLRRRRA